MIDVPTRRKQDNAEDARPTGNGGEKEKMTAPEKIRICEEVRGESIDAHKAESARTSKSRRGVEDLEIIGDDMGAHGRT